MLAAAGRQEGKPAIRSDDLRRLAAAAWAAAIRQLAARSGPLAGCIRASAADGRYAWKVLLALDRHCVVVDLGGGLGGASVNLAPHVAQVFAVDCDANRLALARQRLAAAGVGDRVTLLVADARRGLPFRDRSIDCIVAPPGVLTPAGPSGPEPAQRAKEHLHELRRILQAGGQLLLVAPNDLSVESAMQDLPVRARVLRHAIGAGRLVWRRLRVRFGDLPRSARGYRAILEAAGFEHVDCYALRDPASPLPSITPLDGPRPDWPAGPRSRLGSWDPHGIDMSPTLGIVATASGIPEAPLYRRVLDEVAQRLGASAEIRSLSVGRKDKIVIRLQLGTLPAILRIPLNRSALIADQTNHDMLCDLRARGRLPGRVPQAMIRGEIAGLPYFVESALPGVALRSRLRPGPRPAFLAPVAALLAEISGPSLSRRPLTGDLYERLVTLRLERLAPLIPDPRRARVLADWFRGALHGLELPVGTTHGDFGASNILVDGEHIVGLIDWETASAEDLPIMDAIGYLDSVQRLYQRSDRPAQIIPRLAAEVSPIEAERAFLRAEYRRQGIDERHHPALVHLKWLRHVTHLADFWLPYDDQAIASYVTGVVAELLRPGARVRPPPSVQ